MAADTTGGRWYGLPQPSGECAMPADVEAHITLQSSIIIGDRLQGVPKSARDGHFNFVEEIKDLQVGRLYRFFQRRFSCLLQLDHTEGQIASDGSHYPAIVARPGGKGCRRDFEHSAPACRTQRRSHDGAGQRQAIWTFRAIADNTEQ